ncbi:MAG: alpha/beta fold hydrolase [Bacteroidota bacterium]
MPLISQSSYKAPFYFRNRHVTTVIASTLRKIKHFEYERERITIADGDFLDLDWAKRGSTKLVVLSHGLEGSADRHYVKGTAKHFYNHGWDVLAWNCRSCSGEINRKPRFYHHGATEDLEEVVSHAISSGQYEQIILIGFSMGGNLSLKYAGERGEALSELVKGVVAFSVPCNLESSVEELAKPGNGFYRKRFLRKLSKKIKLKAEMYPDLISVDGIDDITDFPEFDNRYTAPLHGFTDAYDFYRKVGSERYLESIRIPCLLVNAANDPFLGERCYPTTIARESRYLHLEIPDGGGHVSFLMRNKNESWMEHRALEFVEKFV